MKFIVESDKSVAQAAADLELAIAERKFGVLHTHNIHATLNAKGVPFEPECLVLEVCNPLQAARVLTEELERYFIAELGKTPCLLPLRAPLAAQSPKAMP